MVLHNCVKAEFFHPGPEVRSNGSNKRRKILGVKCWYRVVNFNVVRFLVVCNDYSRGGFIDVVRFRYGESKLLAN